MLLRQQNGGARAFLSTIFFLVLFCRRVLVCGKIDCTSILYFSKRTATRRGGSARLPRLERMSRTRKRPRPFSLSLLVPQRLFQRALGFCCATLEIFSPTCRCRHSLGRFSLSVHRVRRFICICIVLPPRYLHSDHFRPALRLCTREEHIVLQALDTYYMWLLILSCNWSAPPRRLE